jgi:hypothetical protein
MAHVPVEIELKVIQHLPNLPYRRALDSFVTHTHECEPCAEAFGKEASACSEYCQEGHTLFHQVAESIDLQHVASLSN